MGVERETAAVATARAAGFERLHADVRSQEVRGYGWGDLDGYTAGPPCQTFSTTGNGAGRAALDHLVKAAELVAKGYLPEEAIALVHDETLDERSILVLEPLLVIARHRPQWILLEQVPTVRPIWEAFAAILAERWGYHVATDVLSAEQFGVPQTRKRAILAAHLEQPVKLPAPTHSRYYSQDPDRLDDGVHKWVSQAEALTSAGLPVRGEYVRSNYGTGGDASKRGVRLAVRPAFAVTGKVGRNKWRIGDQEIGRVTAQEAGVLQTFPADHPWQGTAAEQDQQVGNAVPPLLSAAVLTELTK
ncbi:DNA cytosine methyltransferase [Streptomyces sp. NPDC059874]|uniref:DNA cytosine methyltransferase n=1 Tax=Streptomyces sp. NPDC059874 TaxID=3346983 RepID=UPI003667693B